MARTTETEVIAVFLYALFVSIVCLMITKYTTMFMISGELQLSVCGSSIVVPKPVGLAFRLMERVPVSIIVTFEGMRDRAITQILAIRSPIPGEA